MMNMHISDAGCPTRNARLRMVGAAFFALCALAGTFALREAAAAPPARFELSMPGTGVVITVTEGPGEPRSVGSYAVRLYMPLVSDWPYDNFAHGLVRRRDGVVNRLLAEDIDGDGRADAVVVVKSVGSGGYLSAAAFAVDEKSLRLLGEVQGLSAGADPVAALQESRQ